MRTQYSTKGVMGYRVITDPDSAFYGSVVPRSLKIIPGDNVKAEKLPPLVIKEHRGR